MAGALKKGMLCVAFAAAVGGLAGCDNKPAQPKVNFDGLPVVSQHVKAQASQAALLEMRTEGEAKMLKTHQVTQKEYDEDKKDGDSRIALMRSEFVGADQAAFDAYFRSELKQRGFPGPGDKMPGEAAAPALSASAQAQAGTMQPAVKMLLANSNHVIGPGGTEKPLAGTTTREAIFPGGPQENVTRIDAGALQPGQKYFFEGKLFVDGTMKSGVTLNVAGKVVLNGTAPQNTTINVVQPTKSVGGKDVLLYNDPDPAIRINGGVAPNVTLHTNGGKTVFGTPLQPAPKAPGR